MVSVAVLCHIDFTVLAERVNTVDFTVQRNPDLVSAYAFGEGKDGQGNTHHQNDYKQNDIGFFYHKNSCKERF